MPNLTPIPLSEEEHERLTSLKHKLEANSWREMLMKLCDIYEEYCQMKFDLPLAKDGITTENPAFKDYVNKLVDERLKEREGNPEEKKEGSLLDLLRPSKKGNPDGGEQEMDEEDVRRIIREELENWTIELPEHNHEPKEQLLKDKCEGCGTEFTYTKNTRPDECPNCKEEFDWKDEEE